MLAQESKQVSGVTFIWITDGIGWQTTKGKFHETFNELETLYSIPDLECGVLERL